MFSKPTVIRRYQYHHCLTRQSILAIEKVAPLPLAALSGTGFFIVSTSLLKASFTTHPASNALKLYRRWDWVRLQWIVVKSISRKLSNGVSSVFWFLVNRILEQFLLKHFFAIFYIFQSQKFLSNRRRCWTLIRIMTMPKVQSAVETFLWVADPWYGYLKHSLASGESN